MEERETLLALADSGLKHSTLEYYGQTRVYPLLVDDIVCVNSESSSCVQLADMLSGATCHAANVRARGGTPSQFEVDLLEILLEKKLIAGCIWPTNEVTPEGVGADGNYSGNPADFTMRLLNKDKDAMKKGARG